jgi:hypothetical protein
MALVTARGSYVNPGYLFIQRVKLNKYAATQHAGGDGERAAKSGMAISLSNQFRPKQVPFNPTRSNTYPASASFSAVKTA